MSTKKPTTIAAYIKAAPTVARPHLERLYAILRETAPDADEAIKWGAPFFVEPRFVYSFSAHKAHLDFAPSKDTLATFADELASHRTTANYLQVRYDEPLPEALIRRIARHRVKAVAARDDDSFW